jgi:hypothetical protein
MTGEDIIKHRKIFSFELFGYVKNGLRPYTKTRRLFNCPTKYNICSECHPPAITKNEIVWRSNF